MKSKTLKVDEEIELHGCHLAYAKMIFPIVEKDREYLREWLPWVDITTEEKHTSNYLKGAHQMNKGGQRLTTWIFYKGELCGSVGFVRIDKEHDNAEIGYWLAQDKKGNGIVTRSCQRLIKYGFEKLDFKRIQIRVVEENKPSLAIPKRLGFTFEGKSRQALKIRGEYYDLHIYSMLRAEMNF